LTLSKWNKRIGGDASETGSGPGSYNIHKSVWHVNVRNVLSLGDNAEHDQCCNPQINGGGGWGIFNALVGWQNSATYGSVISYNAYWIAVIAAFLAMRYNEKKGHWPLLRGKSTEAKRNLSGSDSDEEIAITIPEKAVTQSE